MNFLALLAALFAERALGRSLNLGEPRALRALLRLLNATPITAALARSAVLPWLLVIVVAAAVEALHLSLPYAWAQALFGGAVLFLCLGPRDLAREVQALLDARARGDAAECERLSRTLQQTPETEGSHRNLLGALFIQSHERLFGVLLAFVTLGPAGAVLYRIASRLPALLHDQGGAAPAVNAAEQLHAMLAWVPARLMALLFALAGSMDDALLAWRRVGELGFEHSWRNHSWAVLAEVACGALAMEEEDGSTVVAANLDSALREVLRVQQRALLILLAGHAVFTTGTLV